MTCRRLGGTFIVERSFGRDRKQTIPLEGSIGSWRSLLPKISNASHQIGNLPQANDA